ncbi:hypothetical protein BDZ97DRAFT_1851067 [Flammula alnicola]|nr:hypothetical protein BDZ97DRAFT_1851067 [Flammula alnicola]
MRQRLSAKRPFGHEVSSILSGWSSTDNPLSYLKTTTAMDSDISPNSCPTVSALFDDPNADITFKSSDGVLFKIYKKHLESNSAGFAVPERISVDNEVVSVAESSQVLEILFRFIHPCSESQQYRQPFVIDMEPSMLFAVAEAAEKYIVFGAMNTFITRMHQMVSQHPVEILNHCVRHDYPNLVDEAAINMISVSLGKVATGLTHPGLLAKWLIYYNRWLEQVKSEHVKMLEAGSCVTFHYRRAAYLAQALANPRLGVNVPSNLDGIDCAMSCSCPSRFLRSTKGIQKRFADIPKFSSM